MFNDENISVKFVNPTIQAMKVIQEEMAGKAEKANLISEEDILQLVKEIRNSENRSAPHTRIKFI